MNHYQECHSSMFDTVLRFCDRNDAEFSVLPNYSQIKIRLQNKVYELKDLNKQRYNNKTGPYTKKSTYKTPLLNAVMDSSRKLHAFAHFTQKQDLLVLSSISESELKMCSDDELLNLAVGLYEHGQKNLAELVAYGITEETQQALQSVTTQFDNSISEIRITSIDSKRATQAVIDCIKEIDQILKELDLIMEIIRSSNPTLYGQYKEARKIVGLSRSQLDMKIVVKDAATNEPVKNATILITPVVDETSTEATGKSIERKTAEKGGCYEKSLSEGPYLVAISRIEYVTQSVNVIITGDIPVELEIKLVKKA